LLLLDAKMASIQPVGCTRLLGRSPELALQLRLLLISTYDQDVF
jgi:hypothetical protein